MHVADYTDKADDRCSVSGIEIILGGTVVNHANKTQHVVSLSTFRPVQIPDEFTVASMTPPVYLD